MKPEHISLTELVGVELPENTAIDINGILLTNSSVLLLELLGNKKDGFIKNFGEYEFKKIIKGQPFILRPLEKDFNAHSHQMLISQLLNGLWRIKDNSVFAYNFFYIPLKNEINYNRGNVNFNFYTADGEVVDTAFTEDDYISLFSKIKEQSAYVSPKPLEKKPTLTSTVEMNLSSKLQHYNEKSRLERATTFLFEARTESNLPLKITNYISFLETLFSTTTTELSHQVSERAAFFLKKYSNFNDKLLTYQDLKSYYDIRSCYVHGALISKKPLKYDPDLQASSKRLDEICRVILNIIYSEKLSILTVDPKSNAETKDLNQFFLDLIFT